MTKEHCRVCRLVAFFRNNQYMKERLRPKELTHKAHSENTKDGNQFTLQFADKIVVILLTDEFHCHGKSIFMENRGQFLSFMEN